MQKPCAGDSGSGLVWTRGYDKILVGVFTQATDCEDNDESISVSVQGEFFISNV